jgi:2,5-dioxopentanoate dehydrogenase
MAKEPVLIAGQWRAAKTTGSFYAENPATGENLPGEFPISAWADCDAALDAAVEAAAILRTTPPEQIAKFLRIYADRLDARKNEIAEITHLETALPVKPRLTEVEMPRTTGQLRQAAAAALDGSWATPIIDSKLNIRSVLAPVGPVLVFGPNNFPFAFNGVAGGDFAAAIATGNPVIGKGHPNHPRTTKMLAEEALDALGEAGLPLATVQMIYKITPADGLRLASDPRLGALGFTGSRGAGMKLKAAADAVGKPIYLEMSSINPVVILPGALETRREKIVEEFTGSALAACGQMCTSPGLTILFASREEADFIAAVKAKLENVPPATFLSSVVTRGIAASVKTIEDAGAEVITGGSALEGNKFQNTLLQVSGEQFLEEPEKLQTEAFGNASLVVVVRDGAEALAVLKHLEGNLTGSIYSAAEGQDDALYAKIEPLLRTRVGRLLNDKMPTGVAVTAAMNHGGPFPATGHAGFTAVGIPTSLRRFAVLQCYDNVRANRLPAALGNKNPNGKVWRLIDGQMTQGDVAA